MKFWVDVDCLYIRVFLNRLGNSFAVLSFDGDFQRQRVAERQRETSAIGILAYGGKVWFLSYVVDLTIN
jgi:hypothetical protein